MAKRKAPAPASSAKAAPTKAKAAITPRDKAALAMVCMAPCCTGGEVWKAGAFTFRKP